MTHSLRTILAPNPGPFTLAGTWTYLVGTVRVAVVDPGPDLPEHIDALVRALERAGRVTLLPTHHHGDHAGAVDGLVTALEDRVPVEVVTAPDDGWRLETDAGELVALHTPGHSLDHTVYQWPAGDALFAGDMVLGFGDTTWVGEYEGCVADYLASLERLKGVAASVVYPAHGPPVRDPAHAWARYEAHRRERIARVREVLRTRPGGSPEELMEPVYGSTVPSGLEKAALESLRATLEYVRSHRDD